MKNSSDSRATPSVCKHRPSCAGEPHAARPIRSRKPEVRIYQAVVVYGYQLAEVGDELGLHYSTVNWIVGGRRRLVSKVKV